MLAMKLPTTRAATCAPQFQPVPTFGELLFPFCTQSNGSELECIHHGLEKE